MFARADTLKTGSSFEYPEWFSMTWLVKLIIFSYRGRLEHLLHTLLLCLNVGLYFVNMEMIVGLKVTFEVLRQSTF